MLQHYQVTRNKRDIYITLCLLMILLQSDFKIDHYIYIELTHFACLTCNIDNTLTQVALSMSAQTAVGRPNRNRRIIVAQVQL